MIFTEMLLRNRYMKVLSEQQKGTQNKMAVEGDMELTSPVKIHQTYINMWNNSH